MAGESSYVERAPAPALAPLVSTVWVQRVGDQPLAHRHAPHGGAELRCVLGAAPRLLGPLTTSTYQDLPAGATVVGVRLRPGVVGVLAGVPAAELLDQDVSSADLWRRGDLLGDAATPRVALERLLTFVSRTAGGVDPLVDEAVRRLLRGGLPTGLPTLLSISERQLRRRCRTAVGLGPKELHRILRFQGFVARVQASVATPGGDTDLAGWAVEAGYHDQSHLNRECRRLLGVTSGEFLAQTSTACSCGHDHAASYGPVLDGRFVQERRPVPA